MSGSVNFVLVRHLPKPKGLKGPAADSICPDHGPLRLAQLRRTLTEGLGITAPTLVAHSEFTRTKQLAGLLYPDAPTLMLPSLGYAWLEALYGDPYASWAVMEERLGKPVIEATAQEVCEAWPEAASIVPNMMAQLYGLHFKACQMQTEGVPTIVVIGHTGLLELAFEDDECRRNLRMLGEGGIIAFTGAVDDYSYFNDGLPVQLDPEELHPDIDPEPIEIPAVT